jgi:PilZ domain
VDDPFATPPAKLQFPVEVIGADVFGEQFFERTRTLTIHRNGVSIFLTKKLGLDSEVILHNPETNQEAIALVVGQIPHEDTGHVYGFAFLDSSAHLWNMQFPTALAKMVQLECVGCHSLCTFNLSDIELEMFQSWRELKLACAACNGFTTWKETHGELEEKKLKAPPGQELNAGAAVSPIEERRRNRRAGMKTVACVRHSAKEVVVDCEDISKGGFRFTSGKEYPSGIRVEAAAPYTKFSNNIFTSARIIYCHKTPDGKFRHGVT